MNFSGIVRLFGYRVFVGTCTDAMRSEREYDWHMYPCEIARWMHIPARDLRAIIAMRARQARRADALLDSGWRPNVGLIMAEFQWGNNPDLIARIS